VHARNLILLVAALALAGCTSVSTEIDFDAIDTPDAADASGGVDDAGGSDGGGGSDAAADAAGDAEPTDSGGGGDDTGGSDASVDTGPEPEVPFAPAPATLHRLTGAQVRAAVRDVFGVSPTAALEEDTSLHGFVSVAMSELTIPPRTAEQFETLAWEVAEAIAADPARQAALVGCDLAVRGDACWRSFVTRVGRRIWRRPLTTDETDRLVALGTDYATRLGDPSHGVQAIIAVWLQSPDFVFRVEIGAPNDVFPEFRQYTDHEMAARLSFLLWGTTPDDALLDAADRGELSTADGVRVQATRLLADERAALRMMAFFEEFVGLDELAGVSKDPDLFPEMTPGLRSAMRDEIRWLFRDVALDRDADFRELLTTTRTLVDAELAALYGIEWPGGDDPVVTSFDGVAESEGRGGLLGRAGLLALFSHATLNSPTFRGRFVRAKLLCQDVPPPPEGVVTELEEPDPDRPQTLRERLEIHRLDPVCAACHDLMDPLGFALEHFDPVGRWRALDNGMPIDATGNVDGVAIDGASELGDAIAAHPDFARCVARRLYRHASGQLEGFGELGAIDDLGDAFVTDGYRFRGLVLRIVTSDAFRYAAPPLGETCETHGDERVCATACGEGTETCRYGTWTGCSAPAVPGELCDGLDQDCDGIVDEGLARACDDASCGGGVQTCDAGTWGACEGLPPQAELCNGLDEDCDGVVDEDITAAELCDGIDQDCDGSIDEGIPVGPADVAFTTLAGRHPGCDGSTQRIGPECNAAVHRHCAARACSASGFGPLESGATAISVACIPNDRVRVHRVSYATLAASHPGCNGTTQYIGPECNAAIHRWCRDRGETSGYGPVEHSGGDAWVACLPDSSVQSTTYTELSGRHPNCTAAGERIGPNCNSAIHRLCRARGFAAGFGPVENSGDGAAVTCIGATP